MSAMTEKYYESEYATYWIENGIGYYTYKPGISINLAIAKKLVADRLAIYGGKTYPTLSELNSLVSINSEARVYLSGPDAIRNISAVAFLVDSEELRVATSLFINFNKPPLPLKLCTDKQEALEWLNQFKTS